MKLKTTELTGKCLNWAVETLEIEGMRERGEHVKDWWVVDKQKEPSDYATDDLLTGPVIDREEIATSYDYDNKCWKARRLTNHAGSAEATGATRLVAALRCYVVGEHGQELEVPDELCAPDAD